MKETQRRDRNRNTVARQQDKDLSELYIRMHVDVIKICPVGRSNI